MMIAEKPKLTLVNFNKTNLLEGRHILIVESPDSRRAVSLNIGVFSIGRHPNNALVVSDKLISRHHATIAWMRYTGRTGQTDYSYWIIDGKGKRQRSRNGVFVNGDKKNLHRLDSGDIISLGKSIKITYNYITYSSETSGFINYCDTQKQKYSSKSDTSYKDTIIRD
ncbi:MAG: FHA domain-containing protein [Xenococcaceae cyanobacterium MO_188.B29]|nr:FHA domain-containing protein [Xenococcaceae cyanobacterium MO_188.B29]